MAQGGEYSKNNSKIVDEIFKSFRDIVANISAYSSRAGKSLSVTLQRLFVTSSKTSSKLNSGLNKSLLDVGSNLGNVSSGSSKLSGVLKTIFRVANPVSSIFTRIGKVLSKQVGFIKTREASEKRSLGITQRFVGIIKKLGGSVAGLGNFGGEILNTESNPSGSQVSDKEDKPSTTKSFLSSIVVSLQSSLRKLLGGLTIEGSTETQAAASGTQDVKGEDKQGDLSSVARKSTLLSKIAGILSNSLSNVFKATKPLSSAFIRLQRLINFKSKSLKGQESQQKKTSLSVTKSTIVLKNWGDVVTSINSQANKTVANIRNFGDSIYDVATYGFQARDRLLSFGSLLASSIRSYSPAKANQIEVAMGRFRATVGKVLAPATKDIVNLFVNLSKKLIELSEKLDIRKIIKWAVFGLLISLIAGFALSIGLLVGSFLLVTGVILSFIRSIATLVKHLILGAVRLTIFGVKLARSVAWLVVWATKASIRLAIFSIRASAAILRFSITGTAYLATFSLRAILSILKFTRRSLPALYRFAVIGFTTIYKFAIRSSAILAAGLGASLKYVGVFATRAKAAFISVGASLASLSKTVILSMGRLLTSLKVLRVTTLLTTAAQWLYNLAQLALQLILSPTTLLVLLVIAAIVALGVAIWYFWDDIVAFFEQVGQGLSDFFSGVWETIVGWFGDIISSVSTFFTNAWKTVEVILGGIVGKVNSFIGGIWGTIKSLFSLIINAFQSVYNNYLKPIIDKIWETINWIWDKLMQFLNWLWNKIKWLVGGSSGEDFYASGPQSPGSIRLEIPSFEDLKAVGAEFKEAISSGPEGIMEFGANMLEKAGMKQLADGLRSFGRQFGDIFKEPEDDKDVGFEAKEAKESSIEELGKAARRAALGADKTPEEKTAEETKKTAGHTGDISKKLEKQDVPGKLKSVEKSVRKTGELQTSQSQIDVKTVSGSIKRISESQSADLAKLIERIYSSLSNISENSNIITKSVSFIEDIVRENVSIASNYVRSIDDLALLAQDQMSRHDEAISLLRRIEENQRSMITHQKRMVEYAEGQYESLRSSLEIKRAEANSYKKVMARRGGKI